MRDAREPFKDRRVENVLSPIMHSQEPDRCATKEYSKPRKVRQEIQQRSNPLPQRLSLLISCEEQKPTRMQQKEEPFTFLLEAFSKSRKLSRPKRSNCATPYAHEQKHRMHHATEEIAP